MPLTFDLPNFRLSEFKYPELVDERAAKYLQKVRTIFNRPIKLTDDARPVGVIPPGGSATSLHFQGRAFDIRIRDWSPQILWHFVSAVEMVSSVIEPQYQGIELELVWSAKDKHAHIGFFLDGRASKFLVRAD